MAANVASRRVLEKIGMRYERNMQFGELEVAKYILGRAAYTPGDAPYQLFLPAP